MKKILSFLIVFAFLNTHLHATLQDEDEKVETSFSQSFSSVASPSLSKKPLQKFLLSYDFTKSFLEEQALQPRTPDFERLEFLGDRVFGLITAHFLHKNYPLKDIGELSEIFTTIVSKDSLAQMYKDLNVDLSELASDYYHPPINGKIAQKTASDIVEAYVGAIYRDGGFEVVQEIIEPLIQKYHPVACNNQEMLREVPTPSCLKIDAFIVAKSLFSFQEIISYHFKNNRLLYEAFHHPSRGGSYYKKLGFIGVHVLALTIADKIFTSYPEAEEGELMQGFEKIINNYNIEQVFQNWQLWRYLEKQQEEFNTTRFVPQRMAVDTVRAFIGAIYLDGGWDNAQFVTYKLLFFNPPHNFIKHKTPLDKQTSSDNLGLISSSKARETSSQNRLSISQTSSTVLRSEEGSSLPKKNGDNPHKKARILGGDEDLSKGQQLKLSQDHLYLKYDNGQVVLKDDSQETLLRLSKAAEQGEADAQFYLAIYGPGPSTQDEQEAIRLFFKAAEQGHAEAQLYLGWLYACGHQGLKKDEAQAVHWFFKAAEQGLSRAHCNLGFMYADGRDIAKDDMQAVSWFLKAAEQGLATAQNNLGFMYANGRGVLKNDVQAAKWFLKAAEQGYSGAQYYLGCMYQKGQGVEKDDLQAFDWLYKAAKQKEFIAEMILHSKFAFISLNQREGGVCATIGLKLSSPSKLSQRTMRIYYC